MKACKLALTTLLFLSLIAAVRADAQNMPAATRHGLLQAGGGFIYAHTDEAAKAVYGFNGFATLDFTQHLGIEAEANLPIISTPDDYIQKSYLVGVRYVYPTHHIRPYGKFLIGIGSSATDNSFGAHFPGTPGNYLIYSFGGGVDYHLRGHINLRLINFEEQKWPSFEPHGLTPYNISAGVAWQFR